MISLSEFLKTKPIETPEAFSVKSEKKTAFSENSDAVESKKPFQEFLKEASQEKTPAPAFAAAVPAEIVEETPETEDESIVSEEESEEEGLEIQLEKTEQEMQILEFGKDQRIRSAENSLELKEKQTEVKSQTVFETEEPESPEMDFTETEVLKMGESLEFSSEEKQVFNQETSFKNGEIANKEEVVSEMFSRKNEIEEREISFADIKKEDDIILNLAKEKNLKSASTEKKEKVFLQEPERQMNSVLERKNEIPVQQPESSAGVFSNVVQKEPTYQDLLKKLSSEAKKIQTPLKEKISEKEKNEISENPKSVQLILNSKEKKTDSEMSVKDSVQTRKETVRLPEEALQIKSSKETSVSVQGGESQSRIEDRQIPLFQSQRQVRTEKTNAELSFVSNPKEVLKNNFAEILKSVRTNILENGKSQADIILHPKELGRMNILVSLDKDALHGRIFVENENAKSVLLSDLSSLHKELKDIGMELASLQVDLSGNSGFAAEKGTWQEEFGSGSAKKSSYSENSAAEEDVIEYIPDPDRILDIKV